MDLIGMEFDNCVRVEIVVVGSMNSWPRSRAPNSCCSGSLTATTSSCHLVFSLWWLRPSQLERSNALAHILKSAHLAHPSIIASILQSLLLLSLPCNNNELYLPHRPQCCLLHRCSSPLPLLPPQSLARSHPSHRHPVLVPLSQL